VHSNISLLFFVFLCILTCMGQIASFLCIRPSEVDLKPITEEGPKQ
jgi:hypothetical protein